MLLETELKINNQIEIPTEISNLMNIKPGQHFFVSYEEGFIKLMPKKNINDLFGTLAYNDSYIEREEEDRV